MGGVRWFSLNAEAKIILMVQSFFPFIKYHCLFDVIKQFVPAGPFYGRGDECRGKALPAFKHRSVMEEPGSLCHARANLICLCEYPGEGHAVESQPFHQCHVRGHRFMPRIYKDKQGDQVFAKSY